MTSSVTRTSVDLNTPRQLLYRPRTENERVVVAFPKGLQGVARFSQDDYYLEEAMKTNGIPIPIQEREGYPEFQDNKRRQAIYLEDASFGKAFYDVYFKQNMDPDIYKWKTL